VILFKLDFSLTLQQNDFATLLAMLLFDFFVTLIAKIYYSRPCPRKFMI